MLFRRLIGGGGGGSSGIGSGVDVFYFVVVAVDVLPTSHTRASDFFHSRRRLSSCLNNSIKFFQNTLSIKKLSVLLFLTIYHTLNVIEDVGGGRR